MAGTTVGTRPPSSCCFIGNLPFDASEQLLEDMFAAVGPVKSLRLVTDKESGKARGYAFCEYYDRHSAESAVRNLNGADYQGRALRVDFAEETTVHTGDRRGKEERRGGGGGDMRPSSMSGPPPPGSRPVGSGAAATAAASMASMLGGPPGPGPIQNAVNNVLGGLSPMQLYEVMSQMRTLIQQNPGQARHTLISNPQLTKALFQAQILLGMVKPPPGLAQGALQQPAPLMQQQPLPAGLPQPPLQPALHVAAQPAILAQAPVMGLAPHVVPAPAYSAPPQQAYVAPLPLQQAAVVSSGGPAYSVGPGGVLQMLAVDPSQQQGLQYAAPPQQVAVAAPAAPAALPGDQAVLLQQVMAMTQQQIDALPEATRAQVLQVKQLLGAQGALK